MLSTGTILGHYEILSPIGAGGMGEVYRARDRQLDREVAVKILPAEMAASRERVARFQREARAVAALSHPNVLSIHDFGIADGVAYTVMELLEGETLRARILRSPIRWPEAVEIGAAIGDGIAAAHSKGILHRDLKPENIFLTTDGQVKVLDFGLAQSQLVPETLDSAVATDMRTEPGKVMGTVGYMSPEQLRGDTVGPPTDIFSLGCVLYEMLSGHRPFTGMAFQPEPPPLRDVPPALDRMVHRCLRLNPEERFQSARDLGFDLRNVVARRGIDRRLVAGILIAIAVVAVAVTMIVRRGVGEHPAIDSVAVLPFVNVSHDPEADYLSDGVTEALINDLTEIGNLRVIPRASVFRFKGTSDFHDAADKLHVRAVVTGRVLRRGDALNIQADLIDVRNDRQLWGAQYHQQMADLVAVQSNIARDIAEHLRVRISPEQRRRFGTAPTANPAAFDAYLKGRYFWNKRTIENLRKSINYFHQATDIDPSYALAYTGLADAYGLLGYYGYGGAPPNETLPQAKAAAQKAQQLDPTLAEAHTSMANILENYDWNLKAAEVEYLRAIALNPNYPTVHQWLAWNLAKQGKNDRSIAEIKKAQQLDPLSAIISQNVVSIEYLARRFREAEQDAARAREIDPDFYATYWGLGLIHNQTHQYDQAIADTQLAVRITHRNVLQLSALAYAYAVAGKTAESKALLEEILRISRDRYVPPNFIGLIYTGLGDKDSAFEWLEKAYQERSAAMTFLPVEPMLDALRSDPRFADLIRRVDAARR